jgi:hypothetical protein
MSQARKRKVKSLHQGFFSRNPVENTSSGSRGFFEREIEYRAPFRLR